MRELKTNPTVGDIIEILKNYDANKLLHIAFNDEDGYEISLIDENELAVFLVAIIN